MTSSQLLTFGLAGGFVLFASLLICFVLRFRQHLQPLVIAMMKLPPRPAFKPLAAYFSDLALPPLLDTAQQDSKDAPQPRSKLKWVWFGVLLLAASIATWGELGLVSLLKSNENPDLVMPVCGILFAGLLFAFACRMLIGRSLFLPFKAVLPQRVAPPVALWLTNLCLSIIFLSSVNLDLPNELNYLLLGLWLLNILLFCWNVFQMAAVSLPSREALKEWWQAHRLEVLLVALIALAALLIRVIGLETYPYAFINDEGEVGWEGLNILSGQKSNFFVTGWAGEPMLAFLPVALFIKLIGISAFAVRIGGALQGTLAVISLYLLAREAFGRPVAFFSACLLAALPWHVHFSRLGVMNVGDSFYAATVLWLTYRALRKGRYIDYLPAGLMTGLALYTYVGTRLVVAMAIGVLAYTVIRQRDYLRKHFRHLAIFIFAFLIVASPTLYSFSLHFDEFMGRVNDESLLSNNRLQQLATQTGVEPADFMKQQIQDSTAIFVATPGPGQFFDTPQPYLTWWAAVFLFLGMLYVFWNFTQVRSMMLIGWFWAPVILGGALTLGPPSHQRMLSAAPALVLIVAIGLWKFAQAIQLTTRVPKRLILTLCVLAVGFTAWQDLNFYFVGQFRTEHHFEIEGNEFSYEVGLRAGSLGPNYRLLLIGAPDIYAPFADFHYLTNTQMPIEDFNSVTAETVAALSRDQGIFFAAIPARVEELRLVQQQLPGGEWFEVPRHSQEGVLYYGYILLYQPHRK
jgi:4-amino-4-deoxy-L-arabinose transferase-like glycosyltransferase